MDNNVTSLTQKRSMVRVLFRPSDLKEPFDMPVERFFSMLRFENKAKLDDFGLEFDPNTLKSDGCVFESRLGYKPNRFRYLRSGFMYPFWQMKSCDETCCDKMNERLKM